MAAESSAASWLHASPSVSARRNYQDPAVAVAVYEKNIISAKLHRKTISQTAAYMEEISRSAIRIASWTKIMPFTGTLCSNFGPTLGII